MSKGNKIVKAPQIAKPKLPPQTPQITSSTIIQGSNKKSGKNTKR